MGKKKRVIKFIDKNAPNAMSFHLIAKAAGPAMTAEEEAQAEADDLAEELEEQRKARRARLGLAEDDEAKGQDAEEEDDEDEDQLPPRRPAAQQPPVKDERINLLNLAAAAEGIETRAERQARKAAREAKPSQKFYLQPNFKPGQDESSIPADFPRETIYDGGLEEEEYWEREDQKKYELEQQAEAPALLPHNYDYSQHLREMTGRGMFMPAKRGDEMYDPEMDPRDLAPASSSGAAAPGEEEKPENPELLASVEAYQKSLLRAHRRVRATKDFVRALDGDETFGPEDEAFEELQDDFVLAAMMGDDGTLATAEAEEEKGQDEDGEYYEDGEEYYEDEEEGEEERDEDGDIIPRTLRTKPAHPMPRRRAVEDEEDDGEDEEDEEGEDDEGPSTELDAAFDKVLDEYEDDEIGELDHYIDEKPEELAGELELEAIDGVVDEFLHQKEKVRTEGGAVIDKVDSDLQSLTLSKLAIVSKGEKDLATIEHELEAMLNPAPKDNWDAESILSTYSNTENHPRVLRETRSARASRKASKAASASGSDAGSVRASLPAFQPALPVPAAILRAAKAAAGEEAHDEDDMMEEGEEEEEEETGVRENKGRARQIDETPEEKKARKQAVKQAQREAKERKKALKSLYVQETAAAIAKQAKQNKLHPPNIKKL